MFDNTISHLDPTFGDYYNCTPLYKACKNHIDLFNISICPFLDFFICDANYFKGWWNNIALDNTWNDIYNVVGERGIDKGQGCNCNWNFKVVFNILKVLIVIGTHLPSHFAMGPNLSMHLVPKVI